MGIKFRDLPPTKVFQNKEFSFSVLVKGPGPPSSPPSDDTYETELANMWGATVPLPHDETGQDGSDEELPYEVVVEEEGGSILHSRDYSVRSSILDRKIGLFVFFVKIKKNSHYGRTRFLVKVRERQKRIRSPKVDLAADAHWARELLISPPIVVISKERKAAKRKKETPPAN
jgi:hypothetical protein